MSLNSTPQGERIHIALFGRRNSGKSSIINAITNQKLAIVSNVKGTTTDPVYKSMELLPLGPVMIIDTPGLDDSGSVGELRVEKAIQVLQKTDIAVLVIDGVRSFSEYDSKILSMIKERNVPYIIAVNKMDLWKSHQAEQKKIVEKELNDNFKGKIIYISAKKRLGIDELKAEIAALIPEKNHNKLVSDLIEIGDLVILVVPIDKAAPKGRLILPQQQTIRDILDAGGISVVTKDTELAKTLYSLGKKPKLVITDSQVFGTVNQIIPNHIILTSFSILFARYKGDLEILTKGANFLAQLKDGDKILISEGCTHHRQCDDIGTVKLPKWLLDYTKKDIVFEYSSGTEFPLNLSDYAMVIHCGGCMLNNKEMKYRIQCAKKQEVPITNYGMAIAQTKGLLKRSLEVFPDIYKKLD